MFVFMEIYIRGISFGKSVLYKHACAWMGMRFAGAFCMDVLDVKLTSLSRMRTHG